MYERGVPAVEALYKAKGNVAKARGMLPPRPAAFLPPPTEAPVLGGAGDVVTLYHYGGKVPGTMAVGTYWTDWKTASVKSAARMTGRSENLIQHRFTIVVNRNVLDKYFRDAGTKFVPGEGAALEYTSIKPVPQTHIVIKPMESQ